MITRLDIFIGALTVLLLYRLITGIRGKSIPKGLCPPSFSRFLHSSAIEGLKLPPGPPGKFISGNANDMPTRLQWETFSQWAKDYGRLFREGNDMGSGDISKRELWTSAILGPPSHTPVAPDCPLSRRYGVSQSVRNIHSSHQLSCHRIRPV